MRVFSKSTTLIQITIQLDRSWGYARVEIGNVFVFVLERHDEEATRRMRSEKKVGLKDRPLSVIYLTPVKHFTNPIAPRTSVASLVFSQR
jgi:hypothetical protein